MKKIILLSLFFVTNTFSQTLPMDGYPNPPQESKFLKFLNTPITKQSITNGAKILGGALVANKGKLALSSMVVGGVVWYQYLIKHPEKMASFFETHPELLEQFSRYVDYRIEHANTQEEYDTFINIKSKLQLDSDVNDIEELEIKNDFLYQKIEQEVRNKIKDEDIQLSQTGNLPNRCNINIVKVLTENSNEFEENINSLLPIKQNILNKTDILDVNTFKNLKKYYKNSSKVPTLEQDHIPSYAAIDKFLNDRGIKTKTSIIKNKNDDKVTIRDKDLESNETAIAIPTQIHEQGRTYGGRNSPKKIQNDSNNLLEATILDIAFTAYRFELDYLNKNKYNINAIDYINSAIIIYVRNKLICMYDVK